MKYISFFDLYERYGIISGDILDEITPALENKYTFDCVGGGRIIHDPDKKHIEVFGYSQVCFSLSISTVVYSSELSINNCRIKYSLTWLESRDCHKWCRFDWEIQLEYYKYFHSFFA